MKTHYAYCEPANESDNQEWWSKTLCGLEYTESPLTNNEKHTTCKKCLAKIKKEVHLEPIHF